METCDRCGEKVEFRTYYRGKFLCEDCRTNKKSIATMIPV